MYCYYYIVVVVHTLGFKRIKPSMFSLSADILTDERNNLSYLAKVSQNPLPPSTAAAVFACANTLWLAWTLTRRKRYFEINPVVLL